jgi:hypothetical protein
MRVTVRNFACAAETPMRYNTTWFVAATLVTGGYDDCERQSSQLHDGGSQLLNVCRADGN